jgi:protein phosphatase
MISIASYTDKGRRTNNEDNLLIEKLGEINGKPVIFAAVADGMGGMAAGEIASAITIRVLKENLEFLFSEVNNWNDPNFSQIFIDLFHHANSKIYQHSISNPETDGMGTTLVAVLLYGNQYVTANVGDSRAYIVNRQECLQITTDHNIASEENKWGIDSSIVNMYSSGVTRSLGNEHQPEVDVFPISNIFNDDFLLLASDGFHGFITNDEIREEIEKCNITEKLVQNLAMHAFDNGSDDNITVALIKVGESSYCNEEDTPIEPTDPKPNRFPKWLKIDSISLLMLLNLLIIFIVLELSDVNYSNIVYSKFKDFIKTENSNEVADNTISYWKMKRTDSILISKTENIILKKIIPLDEKIELKLNKANYTLSVLKKNQVIKRYPVSLGKDPIGKKDNIGDFRTPEGEYFIYNKYTEDRYTTYNIFHNNNNIF